MKWVGSLLLLALLVPLIGADAPAKDKPKEKAKEIEVPYRLTIPKHILVRAKINNKGPFNFILDTGAPALYVAVPVVKKLGVKADPNGWATFDRFEIEGGVVIEKARGRAETPFQLEGMNGLGLAGAELHGLIGYNILARYRMKIDFARDKMVWTELDYKPAVPLGFGGKGGGQGGLEIMGSVMKLLGGFLGRKPAAPATLRGFLGATLADGDDAPVIKGILDGGPASKGGLRVGDKITQVGGRGVYNVADVEKALGREGRAARTTITIQRAGKDEERTVELGGGI